jgi:hypothetical protein
MMKNVNLLFFHYAITLINKGWFLLFDVMRYILNIIIEKRCYA